MNTTSNLSTPSTRPHEAGFGAALMLIMFSFGALALALIANGSAATYADRVDRYGERIQAELGETACSDSIALAKAKDIFASGNIDVPEIGCHVRL